MPLFLTALGGVTSLVQRLIIIQFVTPTALKAYDVVDFPIFLQKLAAHRAFESLPRGHFFRYKRRDAFALRGRTRGSAFCREWGRRRRPNFLVFGRVTGFVILRLKSSNHERARFQRSDSTLLQLPVWSQTRA